MTLYSDYHRDRLRKNILINSNFNVWSIGTTLVGPNGYTADMWLYGETMTTGVTTVSAQGSVLPNSACANTFKIQIDTAESDITGSEYIHFMQRVEGLNFQPLAGKVATLSFWVYCSTPGTYCVWFRNQGAEVSYVKDFTISSASTWEFKRINVIFNDTIGTWNYNINHGVDVGFSLCCGSTFQTATTGQWVSGNYIASTNISNNFPKTVGNVFLLSQVQLEVGDVATEYESKSITQDVLECSRYYQVIQVNHMHAASVSNGAGAVYANIVIPMMRTTPSFAITGSQIWKPGPNGWRNTTSTALSSATAWRVKLVFQDSSSSDFVAGQSVLMVGTIWLSAYF